MSRKSMRRSSTSRDDRRAAIEAKRATRCEYVDPHGLRCPGAAGHGPELPHSKGITDIYYGEDVVVP